MADYIERSLTRGERIIARGAWPGVYWFGAWMALLLLGVFVVGIFWFAYLATKYWTTRWAATDHRVVLKRGWLTRNTAELAVESIEAVSVRQSLMGRLFNYGEIIVTGAGEAAIVFPPTHDPIRFRRAIETARDRALNHPVKVVPASTERTPAKKRRARASA
ncbi:MAG: PH domain-containing protein [Alphaproteobacteria bacterium]|nr:PH domain-containing protein [Alphaproteobacteria bacterium]